MGRLYLPYCNMLPFVDSQLDTEYDERRVVSVEDVERFENGHQADLLNFEVIFYELNKIDMCNELFDVKIHILKSVNGG